MSFFFFMSNQKSRQGHLSTLFAVLIILHEVFPMSKL